MYKFLAKQGQHNQIARLLTANFGKPHLSLYKGQRGNGVLVTLETTASKRSIDRFLHSQNVPGAVSRRNKYKVIKGDCNWDAIDAMFNGKIEINEVFVFAINGKMKKAKVYYHDYGCECCGGYYDVEFL
jgi:hypothetical protein